MEEAERRLSYQFQRVLIETTRVLSPQFSDSLCCLTGAQLELLRNICDYFHMRSSFVSEYQEDYYVMPDDEDYDAIQAVVADLEDTLMGCAEIEQMIEDIRDSMEVMSAKIVASDSLSAAVKTTTRLSATATAGTNALGMTPVPEGYIRMVWVMVGYVQGDTITQIALKHKNVPSGETFLKIVASPASYQVVTLDTPLELYEGEWIQIEYKGCYAGNTLTGLYVSTDRAL